MNRRKEGVKGEEREREGKVKMGIGRGGEEGTGGTEAKGETCHTNPSLLPALLMHANGLVYINKLILNI